MCQSLLLGQTIHETVGAPNTHQPNSIGVLVQLHIFHTYDLYQRLLIKTENVNKPNRQGWGERKASLNQDTSTKKAVIQVQFNEKDTDTNIIKLCNNSLKKWPWIQGGVFTWRPPWFIVSHSPRFVAGMSTWSWTICSLQVSWARLEGHSGLSTWKYQFSYDHRGQATLSSVSTWIGDFHSSAFRVQLLTLRVVG